MTKQREAAIKKAAAEGGKLLLAVCDSRCANCKKQLPVLLGADFQKVLSNLKVTWVYMTKSEAGDLSLTTNTRDLDNAKRMTWPVLNFFNVTTDAKGKVKSVKVGNGVCVAHKDASLATVEELTAIVKLRFKI